MTSVIINPVAVEDFRSRVEGRVVVEGSGRERGAMNSSGSGRFQVCFRLISCLFRIYLELIRPFYSLLGLFKALL